MTVEVLGVSVDGRPVEFAAEFVVTLEKSPGIVNVAEDVEFLLKFVAELFIPSFDTIVNAEDKLVASVVDIKGVLAV